jgi:hypothetical protein
MNIQSFKKLTGGLVLLVCLTGCASEPAEQRLVEGPKARVRIDRGLPIEVFPATSCYRSKSKGDGVAYSSPGTYTVGPKVVDVKAVTLGMPTTPATPEYYNEYYVDANRPTLVSISFSQYMSGYKGAPSISTTCGPVYSSFIPKEGRDYEVIGVSKVLGPLNQRVCVAEISEIVPGESGTHRLEPLVPMPVPPCSATDTRH